MDGMNLTFHFIKGLLLNFKEAARRSTMLNSSIPVLLKPYLRQN